MARWHLAAWFCVFAVIPFAFYISSVATDSWACFNLLPGTLLRSGRDTVSVDTAATTA